MPTDRDQHSGENQGGSLAVGSFIDGTYRIISFIGQGGMGFVYKVEHLMMAKVMALKILRAEQISESVWKRFRTEAQAIARLDHVNVVRIYDMSQTRDGMPFYTMDFLTGSSLAEYLEQNKLLTVCDSLPVFRQVCAGLAYAHDRGIMHRDIKPGNIMLISDVKANLPPVVKIVDFGIAKLSSLDGAANQGLTRPGEIVGSPLYMSPEQCAGKSLDYRTDMYSVGITMFQALTGKPPLVGKSAIETIAMHQTEVPLSLAEAAPDLDFPEELENIVARLLAKSPEHRYDSLADVAQELLYLERGNTISILNQGQSLFARKNFNTQTDDSSVDESTVADTSLIMLKRAKSLCIIFIAVITPLCLITAAVLTVAQPRKGTAAGTIKLERSPASVIEAPAGKAKDPLIDVTLESDTLSPEQKLKIEAFLKNRNKPFAHLEVTHGKTIRVFDFPEFSIGRLDAKAALAKDAIGGSAEGRVEVALGSQLKFQANKIVVAYPKLLSFFGPDDLQWLSIEEGQKRNALLLENIRLMTGLRSLDLRSLPLVDQDLTWLDKMNKLGALSLPSSILTGQALAKSAILPRLHRLQVHNVSDIMPVLRLLSVSGALSELDISYCAVNSAAMDEIVKMRRLWRLSLRGAKITNADVAKLAQLPQLRDLDLRDCKSLTSDVYQVLKSLKNLEELKLPGNVQNDEKDTALNKALPKLRKIE